MKLVVPTILAVFALTFVACSAKGPSGFPKPEEGLQISEDCSFDAASHISKLNKENTSKREVIIRNFYSDVDPANGVLNVVNVLEEFPLKEFNRNNPQQAFTNTNIINGDELLSKTCDDNTFVMKNAVDEYGKSMLQTGTKIISFISEKVLQETQIIDEDDKTKKVLIKLHRWGNSTRDFPQEESVDVFTFELVVDFIERHILSGKIDDLHSSARAQETLRNVRTLIGNAKQGVESLENTAKPQKRDHMQTLAGKMQPMVKVPVSYLKQVKDQITDQFGNLIVDQNVPAPPSGEPTPSFSAEQPEETAKVKPYQPQQQANTSDNVKPFNADNVDPYSNPEIAYMPEQKKDDSSDKIEPVNSTSLSEAKSESSTVDPTLTSPESIADSLKEITIDYSQYILYQVPLDSLVLKKELLKNNSDNNDSIVDPMKIKVPTSLSENSIKKMYKVNKEKKQPTPVKNTQPLIYKKPVIQNINIGLKNPKSTTEEMLNQKLPTLTEDSINKMYNK